MIAASRSSAAFRSSRALSAAALPRTQPMQRISSHNRQLNHRHSAALARSASLLQSNSSFPSPSPALCQNQQQTTSFSSLADKFWDLISTGSLNRTNPILSDIDVIFPKARDTADSDAKSSDEKESSIPSLPNFTTIRPNHLADAARKVQSQYETEFAQFEEELQSKLDMSTEMASTSAFKPMDVEYLDIVPRLDRINAPLHYVKRVRTLIASTNGMDDVLDAAGKVESIIQFKHGLSKPIVTALQLLEKKLDGATTPLDKERLRAVQYLLRDAEDAGYFLDSDESRQTLADLQSDIRMAEGELRELCRLPPELQKSPMEMIKLMYEILGLKTEFAKMLGYDSYAAWSLRSYMAKDVDAVKSMHDDIADKALPISDEVLAYARTGGSNISEELRVYFLLDSVLDGMFNLCTALFGIVVEEQVDNVNGWHHDVRLFHVSDAKGGHHLASFYLDPFKRRFKLSTEFTAPIITCSIIGRTKPLVCVGCNIKPPTWDTDPVYLNLDDTVALFHEFGHALQHLLARVEIGNLSGAQNIEEDASEFVSQLMEYWLFEEQFLPVVAKHAKTGEMIPPEDIEKMQSERKLRKGREMLHRLALGSLELELNAGFDPKGDESIIALQRRIAEQYLPPVDVPPKSDIALLQQIFESNAGGKRTSQYRYLFSECMSAEAFESFKDAGFQNEEAMKATGGKFRKTILEAGSAVPADEAYRSFRGSDASTGSLMKRCGLHG